MNLRNRLVHAAIAAVLVPGSFATANAQNNSLVATPGSVVINVPEGSAAPVVAVQLSTSGVTGIQFQIQAATDTGQRWLQFSPATGVTPQEISVTADVTGLSAGSYTGVLTVTSPGVSNSPMSIPVRLNYGNQFSLSPASATFTYQSGGPLPAAQSIAVNSTGSASLQYAATPATTSGGPWLLVSQSTGATPGNIVVNVNPMGLAPGAYTGAVTLSSTSTGVSDQTIPVSLNINPNPTLAVSPEDGLNFAYQVGATAPAAQTLTFSSNGAAINFTLSPITSSGGPWLVLSSNSGTASQTQAQKVTVNANVTGLAPGTYEGKVSVAAPGASNPSFDVPITLLVSSNPLLVLGNPPQPFNYQLGGDLPASQTVQVGSSSTPFAFQATAATESGGQWLSVTPATGTTPQLLAIDANPQNLAPGTYKGTVTVASAGAGNSPRSFDVTLVVAASTMLNVSTSGLTFNFQTTTNQQPSPQVFSVTSTGAPLSFSTSAVTTSCGKTWFAATPASGSTPATLSVTVNPTGIAPPQTCVGTLTVSSAGASNTVDVPVVLNVSSEPLLNVSPTTLRLAMLSGGAAPEPAVISLTSTDPNHEVPFTAFATTQTGGTNWLAVGPGSGDTPRNLSVTVNPAGLAIGSYQGTITVASPNLPSPTQVPVTLTISSNVTAAVAPASIDFNQPAGASPPEPATVNVSSTSGALTYSVAATTQQGGNWLSVSTGGGTTPGSFQVSADGANLSQGTYTGQVTVVIPGATNSPIAIPVTFTVGPPQSFTVDPASVTFDTTAGATATINKTINITSTGGALNFAVAKATGCDYLSINPASGTTGATPVAVTLTLNPTGLTPGSLTCAVTVSSLGQPSQTVNVKVNVATAVPSIVAVENAASYAPGAVAPAEVVVIYGTNIGPATQTTFELINDNTAFATTLADTQVLFDGIPAPLLYVSANQVGAVVPNEVAGRPTTTVQVKRADQTSAAVTVRVVDAAPAIFTINQQGFGQGAIVNQSGAVNDAKAPAPKGSIVAIYLSGAGLTSPLIATGGVTPTTTPFPLITHDVTVMIGGQPAMLKYAGGAPGAIAGLYQVNAVVPDNISSGPQPVTVSVDGAATQASVTVVVE